MSKIHITISYIYTFSEGGLSLAMYMEIVSEVIWIRIDIELDK